MVTVELEPLDLLPSISTTTWQRSSPVVSSALKIQCACNYHSVYTYVLFFFFLLISHWPIFMFVLWWDKGNVSLMITFCCLFCFQEILKIWTNSLRNVSWTRSARQTKTFWRKLPASEFREAEYSINVDFVFLPFLVEKDLFYVIISDSRLKIHESIKKLDNYKSRTQLRTFMFLSFLQYHSNLLIVVWTSTVTLQTGADNNQFSYFWQG